MTRSIAALAGLFLVSAAQPVPPLKIVVLAGEDAVNVIQQRTAVTPLVEVRDRNDLPVPGAVVTFAVQGSKAAAFAGGAPTLTIATNAAGQATAAGLTPMVSGAVNITVEAAFQGQIATAAIAQVNVMTAAEAAAVAGGAAAGSSAGAGSGAGAGGVGSAGSAGGAAAGGGGLSGTTLGIIGGVAAAGAAGAVAATQSGEPPAASSYSGSMSMDVVVTFGQCARNERYSGTLEITIETSGEGPSAAVTGGEARIKDGAWDLLNVCSATSSLQPGRQGGLGGWGMPYTPMNGTASSLSFSSHDAPQSSDGSGPIDRTFNFSGSLSGDTITGIYAMTWRGSQGVGFSGQSPVSLARAR